MREMRSGEPAHGLLPLPQPLAQQAAVQRVRGGVASKGAAPATRCRRVPESSYRLSQPLASGLWPLARARAAARAFTLMELLMVMAILAILASITLVVGRSVSERSKIAQAKAEMAVLAAALEQYKQQYGDYPWTPESLPSGVTDLRWDGGADMFNALCGNLGPKRTPLLDADGNPQKGRTFVDLAKFTLWSEAEADLPDPELPTLRVNWFNDPWGRWYYYNYKKSASDADWKSKSFLLYSHGPDRDCFLGEDVETTGLLDYLPTDAANLEKNRDNIYYGRE